MNSKRANDKYIFLDRDGTIIEDKGYLYKLSDLSFLPKVIDGLKKLQSIGLKFIIISNQAGIARKYFSKRDADKFNNLLITKLKDEGIIIQKIYYCPHHPDFTGPCDCRKPEIGLVRRAQEEFNIDLTQSIFVGDKDCDIELGKKCKGTTFLIKNNQYKITSNPDYTVSNILEIADITKI